ncbi:4-hydroxythreonine-4-phosphate dehydrogenase PdxA [Apibacter sp. B2966]|uniref:4-hydroxythreonine-4-phosphate dehydrogenase PdxA n=1 Tax=Apibacter sp. B2966 TaxID=2656761 RepID=UPI00140791B0|nr:4-hydroxythreonine-4-phosphate dehydrogenase PdxA [Apibacter sp. B2966]QII72653.1 4-hydroxythreonine-4-phosphate dehydrogenase PdxA [Apibacter sp. B2966]
MSVKNNKLKIGISIGDPNGIGIEVILKTLQNKEILDFFTPVIFASTKLLSYQKNIFGLNSIYFQGIFKAEEAIPGKINVVNLWKENVSISFGNSTEESAKIAKNSLLAAVDALKQGSVDVLVTAPLNWESMQTQGLNFLNHTEYLENTLKEKAHLLLENNDLRIAFATFNTPISKVSELLSKELIKKQIKALHTTLIQDFCIEKPKIAVLGLNPHAGENGLLGREEINCIEPAVKESFDRGILSFGPYSADSFFSPSIYTSFDGILAMYHDQGLIPFKTLAYEYGVNFTGGLSVVHTEPNHGAAYSIAGQGIADAKSFEQAIFDAIKIYKTRREYVKLKSNALQKTKIEGIDITVDEDLPEEGEV